MADNSFLGKGMKFPMQINPANGRIVVSSESESVKESVYLILMTAMGERLVRPDFGSTIEEYTFMDVNSASINMMIMTIKRQLTLQEPRIANVDIDVESGRNGVLILNIGYTLAGANTRDNLVFPFYLNALTEEEVNESEQYEASGYDLEPVEEITN